MIGDFPQFKLTESYYWPTGTSQLAQGLTVTVTGTVSLATVITQVVRVTMMMMLCPPAARVTVPVPATGSGWTGTIDSERGGARTPTRVFCQCQLSCGIHHVCGNFVLHTCPLSHEALATLAPLAVDLRYRHQCR